MTPAPIRGGSHSVGCEWFHCFRYGLDSLTACHLVFASVPPLLTGEQEIRAQCVNPCLSLGNGPNILLLDLPRVPEGDGDGTHQSKTAHADLYPNRAGPSARLYGGVM